MGIEETIGKTDREYTLTGKIIARTYGGLSVILSSFYASFIIKEIEKEGC